MTIKKTHMMAVATLVILTGGVLTATRVSAQTPDSSDNPMSSLAQKIADKFGLNKDDVQAVFDEAHSKREASMETKYDDRLTQLVSDGKITEDQKALIVAKYKELLTNRAGTMQTMKNMTQEERKAAMEKEKAALDTWAKENNIDVQYLMGMWGGKGHGRHGMMSPPNSN